MVFRHFFVLFLCLAIAEARTISVEKTIFSLTDDTDGSVSEKNLASIVSSVFATRGDAIDFNLKDCTKGSCKFCTKKVVDVCFVATINGGNINVDVTINGHSIIHTDITAPTKVCKDIDFIPDVKQMCVEFTDIDLGKMSGCVAVSVKTQLIPLHFKVGCFTIPHESNDIEDESARGSHQEIAGETEGEKERDTLLKFISLQAKN